MGIAILKAGRVVVTLKDAKASELADHIRNGYPALIPDLPVLTVEEHPDDALPPVAPPVIVSPTPEEIAVAEAKTQLEIAAKTVDKFVLDHENRLRKLEGAAPVTAAEFFGKELIAK